MKKLSLIELNEINFDIVKQYLDDYPGQFKGFEKLINFMALTTSSEEKYKEIEPWIQWASVHTAQKYEKHQIFRLGDIVNYKGEQIFEKIEKNGYRVGCVSPMNAANKLKNPAYFIPDPWTNTKSDSSLTSKALHEALRQAVNDNSVGKIELSTYALLAWTLIAKTQLKNWITYLRLFKHRKKRWNKALFLDLLLSDVFINLKNKNQEDFSCLFLNAFAHVQHHYFLNSGMYKGNLRNQSSYISRDDDPILDAIKIYDRIISNLLNTFHQDFIFATGLRQVPVRKQVVYYRLKNHKNFLSAIGVNNFEVEPRMTRDFLVKFDNFDDLEEAEQLLSKINFKNTLIFSEIERRKNSLFVTLTYSNPLSAGDKIKPKEKSLKLSDEFVFVAVKNGHHDALGYVYTNFKPQIIKSGDHVNKLGKEILDYFGV